MLRVGESSNIADLQVLLEVRARVNDVVGFGRLGRARVRDAAVKAKLGLAPGPPSHDMRSGGFNPLSLINLFNPSCAGTGCTEMGGAAVLATANNAYRSAGVTGQMEVLTKFKDGLSEGTGAFRNMKDMNYRIPEQTAVADEGLTELGPLNW